jgi:hypothetical protein
MDDKTTSDENSLQFDFEYSSDDDRKSIASDTSTQLGEMEESYVLYESEDEGFPDIGDNAIPPAHHMDLPNNYKARTAALRARSWSTIDQRVLKVLDVMKEQGINVPVFFDALLWGTEGSFNSGRIRAARTSLLHSNELLHGLQRMWEPPHSSKTNKSPGSGARPALKGFVLQCMQDMQVKEMSALAAVLQSPANSFVEKDLTKVSLQVIANQMQEHAPSLWKYLLSGAHSKQQKKRNTKKCPDAVSLCSL